MYPEDWDNNWGWGAALYVVSCICIGGCFKIAALAGYFQHLRSVPW